ncbi:hypothetical protein GLUCOINTEAF2_0202959 [Komagataeibacter intermedius AF2]|uniref:Uncharacterized protein n=1 Tax=Komagataeibacter intermedius AF2 TaxID=1458464 RepID=A0A0N1FK08_9PROT|nr:hypothetical protein GLUCOINTEAF2_0202959 [Komagataeibacter intermedius AF2]
MHSTEKTRFRETQRDNKCDPLHRTGRPHKVIQRAVDQPRRAGIARNRRHEGRGTGGKDQRIVWQQPFGTFHHPRRAVDACHPDATVQGQVVIGVEIIHMQAQRQRVASAHVIGQVHAVIGVVWFVAKNVNRAVFMQSMRHKLLGTVMANHAVADDDDVSRSGHVRFSCHTIGCQNLNSMVCM